MCCAVIRRPWAAMVSNAAGGTAASRLRSIPGTRTARTLSSRPCRFRAAGEDLLVTAIIPWNTRYLEHAVAILRQVEDVPDHPLAHLSPLVWEHVNLTGDHTWAAQESMAENTGGLRPLRNAPEITRKAA